MQELSNYINHGDGTSLQELSESHINDQHSDLLTREPKLKEMLKCYIKDGNQKILDRFLVSKLKTKFSAFVFDHITDRKQIMASVSFDNFALN